MNPSSDILAAIVRDKIEEVESLKSRNAIGEFKSRIELSDPTKGFERLICRQLANDKPAVVAESKKASPSKGVMRERYDVRSIAKSYEAGGATCMSVLTDAKYFQGSMSDMHSAKNACELPILRKDFIIDPIQVYESRANGADCILLIMAVLQYGEAQDLALLAREIGLDVLIETHCESELELALELPFGMIGINNRNLHTFETTIDTTIGLARHVPQGRVIVTESGINCKEDINILRNAGISCFLVGEAFMRESDPGAKLADLFSHWMAGRRVAAG